MRSSNFSLINSEYKGVDLTSSVPTCALASYFDKRLWTQTSIHAPLNTSDADSPCIEGEDGTTSEVESSDSATLYSAATSDADLETLEVNVDYPLVVRSTCWTSDAQSIIVRREGSFITTYRVVNPIPRGWIPGLPVFSLPRFNLKIFRLSKRTIEAPPVRSEEERNEAEDTFFTLEKESERNVKEISLSEFRRVAASLGWTNAFKTASSKRERATRARELEVDENGLLVARQVDVNVTYLVTKEVEVYTDDDLALLRGVSQDQQ